MYFEDSVRLMRAFFKMLQFFENTMCSIQKTHSAFGLRGPLLKMLQFFDSVLQIAIIPLDDIFVSLAPDNDAVEPLRSRILALDLVSYLGQRAHQQPCPCSRSAPPSGPRAPVSSLLIFLTFSLLVLLLRRTLIHTCHGNSYTYCV